MSDRVIVHKVSDIDKISLKLIIYFSDLLAVQALPEPTLTANISNDNNEVGLNPQSQLVMCSSHVFPSIEHVADAAEVQCDTCHTRNSSNTSQFSKASDYSSIHTHSRHSSSGDSSHIRCVLIFKIYKVAIL